MFDDPLADFEAQVQSGKPRVALLEALHDPQRVQIVVEALAEALHFAVQRLLAGMGERRMPDIVRQRQRLGQILVQLQDVGQRARDLRDFDGVGQAVAEMVGQPGREDLGLGLQPAEGTGMNHAVAVALESVAVRVLGFGISPPPASLHRKSQPRQHAGRGGYCGGISASSVERHLTDAARPRAQRIQQLAGLGGLLRREEARQRDRRLVRGDENRRIRDQIAQHLFALVRPAVGEVDLRQRELGQRRVFLIALLRHFLEELLGFGQLSLVGLDRAQIILSDLALRRCPSTWFATR